MMQRSNDHDRAVLVAGGGGFIGGALVADLLASGARVRSVDIKSAEAWHQVHEDAENLVLDLKLRDHCEQAVAGITDVYNLAADMGGVGFIENNRTLCMLSSLINTQLLDTSRLSGTVQRFFYASSACVYAAEKQVTANVAPLREADAYPAEPEDGYGWEKLFGERMCRHFSEDFGIQTRIARYHNVYGPHGTWNGGREKAPAAICRKIAEAKISGHHEIEVWGDGEQTRSFTYIDDCVMGTRMIMESGIADPINLGSSEMVSINQLVDMVSEIAGISVTRRHDLTAPLGVRGRNSDNTMILERLGWEPSTRLQDGLAETYRWVHDQVVAANRATGSSSRRDRARAGIEAPREPVLAEMLLREGARSRAASDDLLSHARKVPDARGNAAGSLESATQPASVVRRP